MKSMLASMAAVLTFCAAPQQRRKLDKSFWN
jgi:hypothetical protein